MSSPASRRRQRQRRRAEEKIWGAQRLLDARRVDLKAYDRVIEDMNRQYQDRKLSLFTGAQAIALVTELRDVARADCDRLAGEVEDLAVARKKLDPVGTSA